MSETQRLNWSFAFILQTKDGDSKEETFFVWYLIFFFFGVIHTKVKWIMI